jgi:hypothetical protein
VAPEPEGSSPYSQEPATGPYPEPTGSNLHSPSQSPYNEPALYRLLTFRVPNLQCLGRARESVHFRDPRTYFATNIIFYGGGGGFSPQPNPSSWTATPCRLSATAYSIYSQLPSISGGRLLYPQTEEAPCRGNMGPT